MTKDSISVIIFIMNVAEHKVLKEIPGIDTQVAKKVSPLRSTLIHGMGYSPITNSHGPSNHPWNNEFQT